MFDLFDWVDVVDMGGHYDYKGAKARRQARDRAATDRFVNEFFTVKTILPRQDAGKITTDDKATYLTIDLPGVKLEDIKVDVEDGVLAVSWKDREGIERVSQHKTLDKADLSVISAKLELGVLTVTVPHKEPIEKKSIVVNG